MKRIEHYLKSILENRSLCPQDQNSQECFAPSNIALAKYWGKRDEELFLPENSSLSLSLGSLGAKTQISIIEEPQHRLVLNGQDLQLESRFAQPIVRFLSFFDVPTRAQHCSFLVQTSLNFPHSSGLASSACGFAALTLALNDLMGWNLSYRALTQIARIGSGSASRSLSHGFVCWHQGVSSCGLDSYAEQIPLIWPDIRWGLLSIDPQVKSTSSRHAMQASKLTSPLYPSWGRLAQELFERAQQAVLDKNLNELGVTMEQSCELMHCVIQTSQPPVFYRRKESLGVIESVLSLRSQGIEVYYTQDAGSHIKILFDKKDTTAIKEFFHHKLRVIDPYASIH